MILFATVIGASSVGLNNKAPLNIINKGTETRVNESITFNISQFGFALYNPIAAEVK